MTHGLNRRDPDFEVIGPDTELEEIIGTRLLALQKDFDENGQDEWNANWPEWAWKNPFDEEFRDVLAEEYDFA